MVNTIADIDYSSENASLNDWRSFYDITPSHRSIARLGTLIDPLALATFRTEKVLAVFGYYVDDSNTNLVYFWSKELSGLTWAKIGEKSPNVQLMSLGTILMKAHETNPRMSNFVATWVRSLDKELPNWNELLEGVNFSWATFGKMKFVCVYQEKNSSQCSGAVEHVSSTSQLECLSFHYDYFTLKSPIWNSTPMRFLVSNFAGKVGELAKIHLNPRCFEPKITTPEGSFLWPWQRSIVEGKGEKLEQQSILTTSLVFDLRKSTKALEQLPVERLGMFSDFITDIVSVAKDIIFQYGGFFDKETGDGLIGHFINFDELSNPDEEQKRDSASYRAFVSAIEINRSISVLCENFQSNLHMGISNLGPAVGIHSDKAVWLARDMQIRAIGPSVILANRLCDEASKSSIFISNLEFGSLTKEMNPDLAALFKRKDYTGKESAISAGFYGYEIDVGDITHNDY